MKKEAFPLSVAAMGIVFGSLGTSPIYALRVAFAGPYRLGADEGDVLGILSLIFWALFLLVTIKYAIVMLRADNRGEGGIMALTMLASGTEKRANFRHAITLLGLLGAALFYADGLIMPAITSLSAAEGIALLTPALDGLVLPLAVTTIVVVFLAQPVLTETVENLMGWIMALWFVVLAISGLYSVALEPSILRALNPAYAMRFFVENGVIALIALGAVVLGITGAEALYAEMGRFGKSSIRRLWFLPAFPALVLSYFGQGAAILRNSEVAAHPFFLQIPPWGLTPIVILAILAGGITAHASITGALSLTFQAMNLGYTPRFQVIHTSERKAARVYIPWVSRVLLVGVVTLLLGFGSIDRLAAAYGVAVTITMAITTLLLYVIARRHWRWTPPSAFLVVGVFLAAEMALLVGNLFKVPSGGWLPIALGAVLFTVLATWKLGRQMLFDRLGTGAISAERFIDSLALDPPERVPGTAIFLTRNARGIPHSLLHNIWHNKILHERVILLTVRFENVPHIPPSGRMRIVSLGENVFRINMFFGFKDRPDVPAALSAEKSLAFDMMETSFFLSRETIIPTPGAGMAFWRERLFVLMTRNSTSAHGYFNIPTNRVIELGAQIEL